MRWSVRKTNLSTGWCITATAVASTYLSDTPRTSGRWTSPDPSENVGEGYDPAIVEAINDFYKAELLHG